MVPIRLACRPVRAWATMVGVPPPDIPDASWAMVLTAPGDAADGPLRRQDRAVPDAGPGQVVVAVEACAVCRTDLQLARGDLEAHRLPVVPGHQVVGTVAAVGDGVAPSRLGERVGLVWLAGADGTCRYCRRGNENLCEAATFTGWDVDGGYATHVVASAAHAHVLPDLGAGIGSAATDIAPLLCGGVIGYRALRMTGAGPGADGLRLGLYGFGASATVVIQLARFWGADTYVVTRSQADVERAREMGATWAGAEGDVPPVPLDAAITFAPSASVVTAALGALARGATVVVNAIHLDGPIEIDYRRLWWERGVRSVANVTRGDADGLLAVVPDAGIRTTTEVVALADANVALARLEAGDVRGSFVLVP